MLYLLSRIFKAGLSYLIKRYYYKNPQLKVCLMGTFTNCNMQLMTYVQF
uniref:Uncharacterized protein n=1 Tax=Romanomermis culicivorax TaxID=13658 RepID=A0A915KXP0_ROMCU